jgi:hypothetical protein
MITISYAITVCNELDEIKTLLPFLYEKKRKEDEIVILQDVSKNDPELTTYLESFTANGSDVLLVQQKFKNHFADWKNLLTDFCTKQFVFQIDADEVPHEQLIETLPFLLAMNGDVDVLLVPRVNTVEGLTQDHITKWNWRVNEKGWVNWPDYQWRVYKSTIDIRWIRKVHEKLDGFKKFATLPMEEEFALYHSKEIKRQEKQNAYYDTL